MKKVKKGRAGVVEKKRVDNTEMPKIEMPRRPNAPNISMAKNPTMMYTRMKKT